MSGFGPKPELKLDARLASIARASTEGALKP